MMVSAATFFASSSCDVALDIRRERAARSQRRAPRTAVHPFASALASASAHTVTGAAAARVLVARAWRRLGAAGRRGRDAWQLLVLWS
jgi:hypothetical protein